MALGTTNSNIAVKEDVIRIGGKAVAGNGYSGNASDNGIDILFVKGKSVQKTTEGYNLIGLPDVAETTNGSITYSITDGILSLDGTWDGTGILSVADILGQVAEEGTYVLKVVQINETPTSWTAGSIGIRQVVDGVQTMYHQQAYSYATATKEYTTDEINTEVPLKLYVTNGSVFENCKCQILLTKGSDTSMEYEPYSGGIPSPNPDYPQEIHSFGESMNIQSGTGQLMEYSQLPTTTKEGATVTNNGDGSFTITGSGTPKNTLLASYIVKDKSLFKPGKIRLLCGAQTNPYCNVFIASSGGSLQITNLYSGSETKELTEEILNGDNFYMTVSFSCANSNFINGTIKPVLYQDGNEEWRPFNHETIPVDVPLRSLPNGVCDTYEDGKIVRRVGAVTFDGSEEWATWVLANGNRRFNAPMPDAGAKHLPWISHFKSEFSNEYNYGFIGDSKDICIQYNMASVEDFKEWLAANPMTVLYELETPVFEEVKLPIIPSWHDYTNVWHDSVETDIVWLILNSTRGALPMGGGTIRGDLGIRKNYPSIWFEHPSIGSQGFLQLSEHLMAIGTRVKSGDRNYQRSLLISDQESRDLNNGLRFREILNGEQKDYIVHGSHNKPNGSYTGDGSESREIDLGGVGTMVLISSDTGMAMVSNRGAICKVSNQATVSGLTSQVCRFSEGKLTISGNTEFLNTDGQTYWYQVL